MILPRRVAQAWASVSALVITALAFFMRVYRLGDKNIWWDEGWTVWLSRHDLAWIALRTAGDEHPPLHYWLMHYWNLIAGTDAFAGRFFSLFFGVLTLALIYRLGQKIGGRALGLLAALLLALARFQIWWSQDIKNYTLSAFFALASVWFVLQIADHRLLFAARPFKTPCFLPLTSREWLPTAGYILSMTLALYSHYLAALIFLANNLFVLLLLLQAWRAGHGFLPFLVQWSLAQVAVLALFALWLAMYLSHAATWAAAPAFDFGLFLRLTATVFALGITTYIENYTAVVAGFTLLAALSLGWLVRRFAARRSPPAVAWGTAFALLIVLVPPLLLYVLSLTPAAFFAPKIQARYLLILLPAYTLLLALGLLFLSRLARLGRYLAPVVLGLVLAAQISSLNDYYQTRVLYDEYATLANVVNAFAVPGDGIILNTDQEWPTFLYYLRRPLDWVGVPNGTGVDANLAHRIAAQAAQYPAVWVVTIPDALEKDPQRLVESELARRLPKQYEQTFGDKRLALYASRVRNVHDAPPENFEPQVARADEFDGSLRLIGFDLPIREAQPGDTARVVTYWQSLDLANVRVRLKQPDGTVVAEATTPISIGAHERAEADLAIPPGTRTTELNVVAQAHLHETQLARLHILPRGAAAGVGELTHALDYGLGDSIHLVGYDLPRREFRAGEAVPLTLFWQAQPPVTTSYTVFVHLLGSQYNPAQNNFLWGQVDRLPHEGRLPTTAWQPGVTVDDAYEIPIQADAPRGLYKLEVGMYETATGTRLRVFDPRGQALGDSLIIGEIEIK